MDGHASAKMGALSLPVDPPLLKRCCSALLSTASANLQAGAASPTPASAQPLGPQGMLYPSTAEFVSSALLVLHARMLLPVISAYHQTKAMHLNMCCAV